jgi:hypothetical protein
MEMYINILSTTSKQVLFGKNSRISSTGQWLSNHWPSHWSLLEV